MTSLTPGGFPYPDPGDTVSSLAPTVKALAEKVESSIGATDWVDLAYTPGHTSADVGPLRYSVQGTVVFLIGGVAKTSGAFTDSFVVVANLPTFARPSQKVGAVNFGTGRRLGCVEIWPDGGVRIANTNGTTSLGWVGCQMVFRK